MYEYMSHGEVSRYADDRGCGVVRKYVPSTCGSGASPINQSETDAVAR